MFVLTNKINHIEIIKGEENESKVHCSNYWCFTSLGIVIKQSENRKA